MRQGSTLVNSFERHCECCEAAVIVELHSAGARLRWVVPPGWTLRETRLKEGSLYRPYCPIHSKQPEVQA